MSKIIKCMALGVVALSGLTACNDNDANVFDQSAAIRLEEYKKTYTSALTAEGGKWAMEYFANEEEPGYIFVMTFDQGGGVKVTGLNKYVDLEYNTTNQAQTDESAWEIITDNGPVLTFNTYNNVFHIFSRPEDIADGKTNPDTGREINETGYGHSGDYEFMFMEVSDDGQTVRLKGKKRGYYTYMHRLPADTDDATYLQNVKAQNEKYFSLVPQTILTDGETGEQFVMYNMSTGYCSAYPKAGDDITQTSSANFIVTERGIRFREPFSIERADIDAAPMVIEEFLIQEDGSLKAENGSVIRSDYFDNAFMNSGRNWRWDRTVSSSVYETYFTEMNKEIGASARGQRLQYVQMSYSKVNGFVVNLRTNSLSANIYMNVELGENNTFKLTYNNADKNGLVMYNLGAVKSFIDHLCSAPVTATFDSAMALTMMKLSLSTNPADVLVLNIQ